MILSALMCIALNVVAKSIFTDNSLLFGKDVSLLLVSCSKLYKSAHVGDSSWWLEATRWSSKYQCLYWMLRPSKSANYKICSLQEMVFFLSLLFPDTPLPFMSYILVYSDNPGRNTEETMARVTNMEDWSALHSSSEGVIFSSGPHFKLSKASVHGNRQHSNQPRVYTQI